MVGIFLVGFVWLNLQFYVSWLVYFQWGSCRFFCVMVGRLLVEFVWLNVQSSMSWQVNFQWGSCGSIFSFLCHGWQIFSGVRVAQSLVFCVMVCRLLAGLVWLNLQFSVSWLVDLQWSSCGSIFSFLCHGRQTFSGVRVAQSLVSCVMVGRLLVGFVWLNLQFCVMVGRLLVGFVWLNLQFSVSWLVYFQWGSCSFFCVMVGRFLVGFVWLNLQFSVSWFVDFQRGSCGSIFSFLCHGGQTFSGVRVAQSLVFCVMVVRLLVGFVWLNLQFSVSWLVDFQWGSSGSIFSFLCHDWQTFSGVRVAQSLVLCHGRQTFSGVRVAQSLVFCVMVGRLLVGFVWLNVQSSMSWQVYFQWGSCGSIFSFLCHGRQTFSGFRVDQSLVFCVMVGRLLVGFVWLNRQFSVSWLVDFKWGSCGSIFSFLCHGWQTFSGVRLVQSLVFWVMIGRLLVGFVWLNLQFSVSWLVDFSGVRVAQSLVFCVMVGRLLVGFVWLNLQFCVMIGRLLAGFVWLNLQFYVSWLIDFQWGSFGSIFSFLCHDWQTFSGVRVAQSLVFCVMVGRLLVGFVWLNLQFSVSWLEYFQWGSCGSIFSFLCHGWQTFSWVSVAQSLVFCVMVGRLLVGFVWLNLQFCVMVGRFLVGFV